MKPMILVAGLFLAALAQPLAADPYLGKLSANPCGGEDG